MAGKEARPPAADVLVSLEAGTPFIVVSYFTAEYARLAAQLAAHCRALKIDFYMARVRSLGSWLENVRRRPSFLLSMLDATGKDVAWIDADGVVKSYPALFEAIGRDAFDVAAHRNSKGRYRVGTMWHPNNARGRLLLEAWASAVRADPGTTEQEALNRLLLARPQPGWRVFELPATYCSIFDKEADKAAGPAVIEHFQASRRMRRLVR